VLVESLPEYQHVDERWAFVRDARRFDLVRGAGRLDITQPNMMLIIAKCPIPREPVNQQKSRFVEIDDGRFGQPKRSVVFKLCAKSCLKLIRVAKRSTCRSFSIRANSIGEPFVR
jgi:hypothetical protein